MSDISKSTSGVPNISARHLVGFYERSHYPIKAICDYLAEGLRGGETVVSVVTTEHAEWIQNELRSQGLRVDALISNGRFACADVEAALVNWLDPKIPEQEKDALMERWLRDTLNRAPARSCRFLGEMVSLMLARGAIRRALDLEDSWNRLLAVYPAMLYCAYEQTPFEKSPGLDNFCEICNRHDAVLAGNLRARGSSDASAWFVILQEQASALREEVMRRRMAERMVFVNEASRLTQLEALLRTHGPSLNSNEKNEIVKVVTELKVEAWREKRTEAPESPEWHKKTGEILGYDKVIASVMNAGKKPNGDPSVS